MAPKEEEDMVSVPSPSRDHGSHLGAGLCTQAVLKVRSWTSSFTTAQAREPRSLGTAGNLHFNKAHTQI